MSLQCLELDKSRFSFEQKQMDSQHKNVAFCSPEGGFTPDEVITYIS